MAQVSDEVIVPWHTGDYNLDQIYPNSNVCPRLDNLEAVAYASPEWIAENTSTAITQLTSDLDQIWGAGAVFSVPSVSYICCISFA